MATQSEKRKAQDSDERMETALEMGLEANSGMEKDGVKGSLMAHETETPLD